MSSTHLGIKRSEGYLYGALHQGFAALPAVILLVILDGRTTPWSWLIGWALLVLVAACAGLSVLHTRLRDLGFLPRSGWDWCYWPRHQKIAVVAWVVFSLAATGVAGFFAPKDALLLGVSSALLGGLLALPALLVGIKDIDSSPVSTLRIAVAAVVAVAFSLTALWAVPAGDDEMLHLRFATTFWAGFLAIFFVSFGSMFVNVIATTRALERARTDEARLAVAEERVRFARDLHDVFGRTLSAVALKSELAAAQAERGRPEASATMREVQAIATDALTEVRDVVRGYREADLGSEVAGAKALLEAAGINVTTMQDGSALLPVPVARAFAWTVREAATNVLRHADATSARIDVRTEEGLARLEVVNNHPHPTSENPSSGLAGLAERMAEVGGALEWEHREDSFRLTATVEANALGNLRHHLTEELA